MSMFVEGLANLAFLHWGWTMEASQELLQLEYIPERFSSPLESWKIVGLKYYQTNSDRVEVSTGDLSVPPRFGVLGALLGTSTNTPRDVDASPSLPHEQLSAMEAAIFPRGVARPISKVSEGFKLIDTYLEQRQYFDAIFAIEELFMQDLNPVLTSAKTQIVEGLKPHTFLKYWPTKDSRQAHFLLEHGSTSLFLSRTTDSSPTQDPSDLLAQLRSIDSMMIERDHVLEALKGIYALSANLLPDAEQYFLEALRQNSRLILVWKLLGDTYLALREPYLAWAAWSRARALVSLQTSLRANTHPIFENIVATERILQSQFLDPLRFRKQT